MGFFGTFHFSDGQWTDTASGKRRLTIDIHDSDTASVVFHPAKRRTGRFYVGVHPRDLFDDPKAGETTNAAREAEAFAGWARATLGSRVTAEEVQPFIAEEGRFPEEPFAETAVANLLQVVGLPLPEGLRSAEA
jgi:hypothetical protein